jgi:predicted RND superfamily exporter protein
MTTEQQTKTVDNIYIYLMTSQFLLDFAEEHCLNSNWAVRDLKSSLKTTMRKLEKLTSIPFVEFKDKATPEIAEQQVTGSSFAEQNMRLALKFDQLNKEEQFRFQILYENLLSQFNIVL